MTRTVAATQNSNEGLRYVSLPLSALQNLSAVEAVVYSYMLNRYWFFKQIGKQYYENIKDIALATGQSERNTKRAISKLKEHHITVTKKKLVAGNSNTYEVHDLYGLYTTWITSETSILF